VIASRLGLDPAVVDKARQLLGTKAVEIDRILSDIESDRKAYEYELERAARLRVEADTLRTRSRGELEKLRAERKQILARAREDAEAMLARARREVDAIIESLRTAGSGAVVQEARASLGRLREELEHAAEEPPPAQGKGLTEARPGQTVFIVALRRTGTVMSAPDARGEVEVETGGMRVRVGLGGLQAADPAPEPSPADAPAPYVDITVADPVPMSLTLRGDRVDEAIPKLDKYLDEAFVARLATVTIIHGKGTGALRKAVHEFLSHHPYVKAYRLGERGEGEAGATVVELDVMR
ncbi:MAG: Smr/MutS family protein, partial [bacterium]